MKVTLSTIGRFHMFPLARELERHGVLNRIYSGFPWSKLAREGVSKSRVTRFPYVRPILMGTRVLPFQVPAAVLDRLHQLSVVTLDHYVARTLPDSDIFVGHEGVGLLSGAAAQRRGMLYICDRGCAHMAWRERLLNEENARFGLPARPRPRTYAREIEEYHRADLIVVASEMAKRSFLAEGIDAQKIAIVPYGVNFDRFHPVGTPSAERFEVVFVGGLSLRKGAMDLVAGFEAANIANKRLTIIGQVDPQVEALLGARLSHPTINRLGHVPHDQLKHHMSRAHVMVMPSIEDGFGMVVGEAMACGCPVIVSNHTGAADIVADGENGYVVPIRAPEFIAEKLEELATDPDRQRAMSKAALHSITRLGGWDVYGQRMIDLYAQALNARGRFA
ncbi:glycosyltransferase [Aliiroseovarius crassostreae]|uniref:glycosyltransferase n=1 Tax=Aliiroseovarius crassostreae TaxID=154981 RepID=UPI0022069033|nr:glycosyltransferase [Aliiroseovarius crassostreae]UWP88868.1 glycosyltransferase [Aliiroseovarius crassostreae]UWQ01518.1 glycosyltransferase [Aliiroseovarius crassostreae]